MEAQTRLPRQKPQAKTKAAAPSTAQLMNEYRFDEAIELIQKEITAAQKARKPTYMLEADLKQARLGANMLRGTERVVFIDSVVVNKKDFMKAFHLSEECGTIGQPSHLYAHMPKKTGVSAHMNELKDRIYYSCPDSSGVLKLATVTLLGNEEGQSRPLEIGEEDEEQDYPYMMSDGVTLYYAAQGEESLGGYDIFVTRYNPETRNFVKPENIGMPFNSPANDYLYAIDEAAGIGWFATDRNQPSDKVCIYRFIPSESREIYEFTDDDDREVRDAARIHAIADSQSGEEEAVKAARKRLQALRSGGKEYKGGGTLFIIDDNRVYTSLEQFRSPQARRLAEKWMQESSRLKNLQEYLPQLRRQYTTSRSEIVADRIREAENELLVQTRTVNDLAKKMRRAELQ